MNGERWEQVRKLLESALDRPPDERAAFLDDACGDDAALRGEVDSLMARAKDAESLLEEQEDSPEPSSSLIGRTLSHYRILAEEGRGGMGVVYRARDVKLARDIALKVLPKDFVEDQDRLARFEREARVLGALNHPGIATVHEIDHVGGVHFLVMELVAGETLAERIARRPLSVDEALPLFEQIADALEAAHDKGIVHRDLKPANVKLTPQGRVTLLDFGLAKALVGETTSDLSQSPTFTRNGTVHGIILGTAPYMSPEQARGLVVDKRTDVWSFGCVLFEALTGRLAFWGETVSDTIAAILGTDPDWDALPTTTPTAVRTLLKRCLEVDPDRRLHDIADARIEIEDAMGDAAPEDMRVQQPKASRRAGWIAALAAAALAVTIGLALRPGPESRELRRLSLLAPEGAGIANDVPAISPDGTHVAFVAETDSGTRQLWLRPLASETARLLPGTEGGKLPFWSPDSRHLAFFANGKLARIDLAGGAIKNLADVERAQGGSWGSDGVILFAPHIRSAILGVSADGGPVEAVTTVDPAQYNHGFPQFLPDGKRFLYTVWAREEGFTLWVGSLETGEAHRYFAVGGVVRYASGYLLYEVDGWLMARRFDPDTLRVVGEAVAVSEERSPGARGSYIFSASRNGVLVYASYNPDSERRFVWYDREGRELETLGAPGQYAGPQLSPDETQLAFELWNEETQYDVWIWDLSAKTPRRLMSGPGWDRAPVWEPDGKSVVFASQRGAGNAPGPDQSLFRHTLDDGRVTLLLPALEEGVNVPRTPVDWTADGHYVLFFTPRGQQSGLHELWALPLFGEGKPIPIVRGEGEAALGQVSPDGQWLAYSSGAQLFVKRFPEDTGRIPIASPGLKPRWRGDGKELYFLAPPNRLMAVDVETGPAFRHGTPRQLFEVEVDVLEYDFTPYDVTSDGERFIANEPVAPSPIRELHVVLNWDQALAN